MSELFKAPEDEAVFVVATKKHSTELMERNWLAARHHAPNPPPHSPKSGVPWAAPRQSLGTAGIEMQAHPWETWSSSKHSLASSCLGWNSLLGYPFFLCFFTGISPHHSLALAPSFLHSLPFFSHNACSLNVLPVSSCLIYFPKCWS